MTHGGDCKLGIDLVLSLIETRMDEILSGGINVFIHHRKDPKFASAREHN